MIKSIGQKGLTAEESLRAYFRSTGYFVVRSIPLVYRNYDVTDVDLWLYVKATPLAAERACVDVKRRKTPQAMERVLWTKGLKEVLSVDRAIVVTSDNRPETREFGAAHGVNILQGDFLQHVVTTFPLGQRLTEEEFFTTLKSPCVVNPDVEKWLRLIGQNFPFLKCSPAVVRLHGLSQCRQVVEVELIRRFVVKRRVRPALVVKRHVFL